MRWLVAVMLACGMLRLAHAQPEQPQPDPFGAPHGGNSSDLFNEGRRLVTEGRIDQACVRFEESWRVEEAIGTALNLADCRERQGQLVQARILFLRALEIAKRTGDATRETFAQNRVTALEAHLATLQVYLTPPVDSTLALTIDGAQLVHFGAGQRELLEPRVVRLRAITSMGRSWETDVKLRAGARELVEV
ncbi:MAG TPA: hypothetical protein VLB44_12945, partial [Kofleriaceae bacterium]|nr:hypothetical protein [Kofleriaceae bacterium]